MNRILTDGELVVIIDRMDGKHDADFWIAIAKYQDAKTISRVEQLLDDIQAVCQFTDNPVTNSVAWKEFKNKP